MSEQLESLLETLHGFRNTDLDYELRKLKAIKDWALKHAGVDYGVGDRVKISDGFSVSRDSGWWPYRECLAPGSYGHVTEIDFNSCYHYWYATIQMEREWSQGTGAYGETRWWHGAVEDTPEGFDPPSPFDQEKYPNGRKHTFSFKAADLKAAESVPPPKEVCDECGREL